MICHKSRAWSLKTELQTRRRSSGDLGYLFSLSQDHFQSLMKKGFVAAHFSFSISVPQISISVKREK